MTADESASSISPDEGDIVVSADRFFSATAMGGHLHVNDIGEYASWDPARILYWREHGVDAILPRMVMAKVRNVAELDEAIVRSQGHPGSISMFVHEDLLDVARNQWERMREDPNSATGDSASSS